MKGIRYFRHTNMYILYECMDYGVNSLSLSLSLSSLFFSLSLSLSLSPLSLSSRAQEEREREAQLRGPPKLNRDEAATRIQKVQETKRN